MAEVSLARMDLRDRAVEQAILSLKKGAYLLKCGKRGKPKFCPFRLSTDEKFLVWYPGEAEKQLKLNSIIRITRGQQTLNFLRQQLHEKERQSFSVIYRNGEKSLDLICKDREQAELWLLALNFLLEFPHYHVLPTNHRNARGSSTCTNSPHSNTCRKKKIGYLNKSARFSQARSLSGSPPESLLQRHFSVSMSYAYKYPYCSTPEPVSSIRTVLEENIPHFPHTVYNNFKEKMNPRILYNGCRKESTTKIQSSISLPPSVKESYIPKDVFLWGEGVGGTLGGSLDRFNVNGVSYDSLLPKLLEPTRMLDVRSISCGRSHAAIVTKHGEIFTWGEEKGGRLGHRVDMDVPCPKVVESLQYITMDATSCGTYHTCALTSSGELYLWGSGCQNGESSSFWNGRNRNPWFPHRMTGPMEGIQISRVACGEWHTAVVTSSGQLFTFGDGTFGALGHGDLRSINQPKEVESLKGFGIKSVACGPWHTAAIVEIMSGSHRRNTLGGKLFTWGDSDKGKLGHADKHRKLLPTCVSAISDCDFVQVACGDMLTVALSVTGIVFTIGSSDNGQLGNPLAADKSITVVEGDLKGKHVKKISCGSAHVVVLTTKKEVYSWGRGANGRLGLGDTEDRNSPTLVEALKDMHVENIACGSAFTASVCLHTTTLGFNQSVCFGCKVIFNFTRKKHNCYNCGFAFCSICTSRKSTNASLAPSRSRQFRVCNPCFVQLNKCTDVNLKSDIQTPRALSWARKFFDTKTDGRKFVSVKPPQISPYVIEYEDPKYLEKQQSSKKGSGQESHRMSPVGPVPSSRGHRWGQVSCPSKFIAWNTDNPRISFSFSSNEMPNSCNASAMQKATLSRSTEENSVRMNTCKTKKDAILAAELERLQAEVKSLTKECQMKSEKLLLYKQRIEGTWSLAREEATKCKAAKDIVKVLTCQINAIAGKFSTGKELNLKSLLCEKLELNSPQITPVQLETLDSENAEQSLANDHSLKHGKTNLLENSLRQSDASRENSIIGGVDIYPSLRKETKDEFMEQVEPGVYVTFARLPNGKKGLRRVRFSRKQFTEAEARKWWEENQRRIYRDYCT